MSTAVFYDAVIIGAGPAGCTAGRALARNGKKVLLIDKDIPGRNRVCGGFLGPEVSGLMKKAALEKEFELLNKRRISRLILSGPMTRSLCVPLGPGVSYSVDRGQFDEWLCQNACQSGARLSPDTMVEEQQWMGDYWKFRIRKGIAPSLDVHSGILIRAHGRRTASMVKDNAFFACKTVYDDVNDLDEGVALHFIPSGHVGLNSFGGTKAAMCLYVRGDRLRQARGDLDGMMQSFMRENKNIGFQLSGAKRVSEWVVCAAESDGKKNLYQDRAFYAGDAVAMANPIIGGGISLAMASGLLLAGLFNEEKDGLRGHQWVAERYSKLWTKNFDLKIRLSSLLGNIERNFTLSRIFLNLFEKFPGLLGPLILGSRPNNFRFDSI